MSDRFRMILAGSSAFTTQSRKGEGKRKTPETGKTTIVMKPLTGNVLITDDDSDIRDILRDTLNSLGVRVVTAGNGQECLDKVDKESPDLILLDIEMPIMNGLDVLKELSQRRSSA